MTNFDVFYLSFPGSLQHCMSLLILIAFRVNYIILIYYHGSKMVLSFLHSPRSYNNEFRFVCYAVANDIICL